ncbi:hypothetical protein [Streptomyces sp. NPDC051211]|uniref:hypothetical protein n=1 Tax=Streptomyces sp. NPDC051211 TaxID=3154643 RepID=UPI00344CAAE9
MADIEVHDPPRAETIPQLLLGDPEATMGAIRTSATALLVAGATAAAGAVLALGWSADGPGTAPAGGPPAARITSFGFAITPSTVAPGASTVLSVTACNSAFATAYSGVFDSVSIPRGQTVRVTIDRDARPGAQYSVAFTCNGETGSADLTIAGGNSTPTARSTATSRPTSGIVPRSTTTPTTTGTRTAPGAVRGGVGGSRTGMDAAKIGAGAALFLAGVAGTVYAVRRRTGTTTSHRH